ncbi:hypothetical protein RYX36_031180, partial [Vicia faba]
MASQISVCVTPMLQSSGVKHSANSNYPFNFTLQSSLHSLRGTRPVRIVKATHDKNSDRSQPIDSQASQDTVLSNEILKKDAYAESFHQ